MSGFAEFLQAFVANHNATVGTTPHPLMGPNGAQVWTMCIGGDRRQLTSVESITVPDGPGEIVVPARRRHVWHRAGAPSQVSWKLWGRSPA